MHWMMCIAVFCVLNESALSWKGLHHGQLSCPSLQCLFLPSNVSLPTSIKQETTPSLAINTWYPIPKWRIFFDPRKSKNGYSQSYFNKQETRKTDGYIYENDFFYNQKDFFEELNIKFFPLQDGYIAVKGFKENIHDSVKKYVALFVVYAHPVRKSIQENVTITEKAMEHGKENGNVTCDQQDDCNFSISETFSNMSVPKNVTLSKTEKIVSFPIFSNMSIEMEVGEQNDNNYTVVIMPFLGDLNTTKIEDIEKKSNIFNLTLSKNMSVTINCSEINLAIKPVESYIENATGSIKNISNVMVENMSLYESPISDFSVDYNSNNLDNSTTDDAANDNFKTIDFNAYSTLSNEEISDISTYLHPYEYKNLNDTNTTLNERGNITDKLREGYIFSTDSLIINDYSSTDIKSEKQLQEEYLSETHHKMHNFNLYRTNTSNFLDLLSKYDNVSFIESYEIKALNTEKIPFIVTLLITLDKNDYENKSDFIIKIESKKLNKTNSLKEKLNSMNFTKYKDYFRRGSIIEKRDADKEYIPFRQNSYAKSDNRKDIVNSNHFNSLIYKISNKPLKSPNRKMSNKTKMVFQALKTMNYFPLILPKGNTEWQNRFPELFLNLERPDSYSPTTILRSNEEFNKKNTYKFRNKRLIQNQILENADGADNAKSNHIAYKNRNKRGITLPTLIPNKDSRENHSLLKKSELQIVEKGSFDRHLSRWKRKISPGVMRLLRNDIKMSKICALGDGCNGINDVFSGMSESKYQRVQEEKLQNFDSEENMKVDLMHSHSTMENKQNMNTFSKIIKNRNSKSLQISNLTHKQSNIPLYSPYNNTKINISGTSLKTFTVEYKNEPLNVINYSSYNSTLIKMTAPKLNLFDNLSNIKPNENLINNNLNSNSIRKNFSKNSNNSLNSELFIKTQREHSKNLFPDKISRKRRSNSIFVPIYNHMYPAKQSNLKIFPNEMHLQTSTINANSVPSVFAKNYSDLQQQNFMQPALFPRENFHNFNEPPNNSENREGSFKRLPQITNNRFARNSNNHGNERILANNFAPEYKWIIIIPEDGVLDTKEPRITQSSKSSLNNKNVKNFQSTHSNSDREREDDSWEYSDWISIDSNTEQPKENVNKMRPQIERKPWDIINIPSTYVLHSPTKHPTMKAVLRTTKQPVKKSTSYPPRGYTYPYERTTKRPWSTEIRWETGGWEISHNPWHSYFTTPMMMGNMAGGD